MFMKKTIENILVLNKYHSALIDNNERRIDDDEI